MSRPPDAPPPRVARLVIRLTVPRDVRDAVLADLDEVYRARVASDGPAAARTWYRREALSFSSRFTADRARERGAGAVRRGRMRLGLSWLDVKLAARMFVRYPGLSAVSVVGMAAAITIAGGAYSLLDEMTSTSVPLDEGDRVVSVYNYDLDAQQLQARFDDLQAWRAQVSLLVDLGAYRAVNRNLIAPGAAPEVVRVAEMTASGFRLARVAPLRGRFLRDGDELPAAPPVAVIGAAVWERRFGSDPGVLGTAIQLGDTQYTIVGVMPADFVFPVNFEYWTPLRIDGSRFPPGKSPLLQPFARLAPGATLAAARAEMEAVGQRASAESPTTHGQVRPRVLPYSYAYFDLHNPQNVVSIRMMQGLVSLLLMVVAVNVSILVYARTATRQGEIAVRGALGASRRRIVTQLFVEALALSSVAAVAGLLLVVVALRYIRAALEDALGRLPFWLELELTLQTVFYVGGLAILAASIIGVVPALKATGRRVQANLQTLSAGGGSRMQLGRTWTILIVAQVAFAVAILPTVVYQAWFLTSASNADPGFAAEQFISARVQMDRGTAPATGDAADRAFAARRGARQGDLLRRLSEEPGVAAVTFGVVRPGEESPANVDVEGSLNAEGHAVRSTRVGTSYFDVFGLPMIAGRGLNPGDASEAAPAVIVNRTFAARILGEGNPIGRRIKYQSEGSAARWYEVVGVVEDMPGDALVGEKPLPKVYHATTIEQMTSPVLAIHLRGTTPAEFNGRLRELAAAVDPDLQLQRIQTLDEAMREGQPTMRLAAAVMLGLTLSIVVLSAAGIYAMMSFTVARRRREIGIRAALGADPRQLLMGIFSRALAQLALGAAIGMACAIGFDRLMAAGVEKDWADTLILPGVALFMVMVGLMATLGPARQGLRVQPTEALRSS